MLGVGCDMKNLIRLAKKHGIKILEDNCEAFGAKYKNKYLGTLGDAGIISLDFGKVITTGEGGIILTNSKKKSMIFQNNITIMDIKISKTFPEV